MTCDNKASARAEEKVQQARGRRRRRGTKVEEQRDDNVDLRWIRESEAADWLRPSLKVNRPEVEKKQNLRFCDLTFATETFPVARPRLVAEQLYKPKWSFLVFYSLAVSLAQTTVKS